ncbi:YheC/YheD family protein [Bacillus sp. ISL-40]|uniref:YheC/YheD family protein n=1 Tax=unclassified Bacillus (in: firmicutes) TaxID=185979 RepID=UPI001BEB7494|nr:MULTISPECIES: YheC/YheD family protein [unclassified Bacillus (in: firmicutes)]MBT2700718.1 YheC/YheD family protein [Bacillus sp. ISL-40]MBT2743535.1 YheC/YheD family protein [Bacillus sp. ISL-77]
MTFSYGKWTKYQMMKEEENLVQYLPETMVFSVDSFWAQLGKFGTVVMKPSEGSQGYGVVQVSMLEEGNYEIHYHSRKRVVNRSKLEEFLAREKYTRKLYIVQEKIPLACVGKCPFDVRVMVQRKQGAEEWHVTGKAVKVADEGYFITNIAKEILTLNQALERSDIENINLEAINTEIDYLSIGTAAKLGTYYQNSRMIGLDIGITGKGQLYIIEANLKPSIGIFKKFLDKQMLRNIRDFRK